MLRNPSNRGTSLSGWLKELFHKIFMRPGYEPIRFYLKSRREQHDRMTY